MAYSAHSLSIYRYSTEVSEKVGEWAMSYCFSDAKLELELRSSNYCMIAISISIKSWQSFRKRALSLLLYQMQWCVRASLCNPSNIQLNETVIVSDFVHL